MMQLLFCSVNTQSKYSQATAWLGIILKCKQLSEIFAKYTLVKQILSKISETYSAAHMSTPRGHRAAGMTAVEFLPSIAVSIVLSTGAVGTGA
jgi:hypothetical protein